MIDQPKSDYTIHTTRTYPIRNVEETVIEAMRSADQKLREMCQMMDYMKEAIANSIK